MRVIQFKENVLPLPVLRYPEPVFQIQNFHLRSRLFRLRATKTFRRSPFRNLHCVQRLRIGKEIKHSRNSSRTSGGLFPVLCAVDPQLQIQNSVRRNCYRSRKVIEFPVEIHQQFASVDPQRTFREYSGKESRRTVEQQFNAAILPGLRKLNSLAEVHCMRGIQPHDIERSEFHIFSHSGSRLFRHPAVHQWNNPF